MTTAPSITIGGKEYEFENLTTIAYLRLAVIIKPLDGTPLSELTLDDPATLTDPKLKAKAIADREKTVASLQERLADDISTRRLAYALKSVCPALVEDGLVVYEHIVRPDDYIELEFAINLEMVDILNIMAKSSTYLSEKGGFEAVAKSNGFQPERQLAKPRRRR